MHGTGRTGLPEGKQSRMPDTVVAVEKYSKLYVPVAGWGLKPSCLEENSPLF